MTGGGAARVAAILIDQWSRMGIDAYLTTFEPKGAPSAYEISPAVQRIQIGYFASAQNPLGMLSTNWGRIRELRNVLRAVRPQAVVSFLLEANVVAVMAAQGLNIPVYISERNHPAHLRLSAPKRMIRRQLYPRASELCVQTTDIAKWFKEHLRIDCQVIPNPVNAADSTLRPSSLETGRPGETHRLLALGRLESQKGFDLLIKAFAMIAPEFPEWTLIIHGEGAERRALEEQINQLGLAKRAVLPGTTREPLAKLLAADIYVHPARFEGYPNALLEALVAARCVVATDCPGATREVLADGRYGLLARNEDVTGLAERLREAMGNAGLRERFSRLSHEAVRELTPSAIAQRWLDLIAGTLRKI